MDECVYHPGHMPQEPGDGITLVGRTSSQDRVVQPDQSAINHLPVPLQGTQYAFDCSHASLLIEEPSMTPCGCDVIIRNLLYLVHTGSMMG